MIVNKKGISLVVLVITIIVMIILASAVIISLNNANIINNANSAINNTNLETVREMANIAWGNAFNEGSQIERNTDSYFQTSVESYLTSEKIDISKYKIIANASGVSISIKSKVELPEGWENSVVDIVDGVPIPKGFVVSPYTGENTKVGGLVIYQLKSNETAIPKSETQLQSKIERNQYVWIPVNYSEFKRNAESSSDILGCPEKYWEAFPGVDATFKGMVQLTDYQIKNGGIEDTFKILNYNYKSNTELELCASEFGDEAYVDSSDFVAQETLDESVAMYASVKKYGGFYVGRYELGIDGDITKNTTTPRTSNTGIVEPACSKQNKYVYNYLGWNSDGMMNNISGGLVQLITGLYTTSNANFGVVSTLIYGVQWDAVMNWMNDIKNPNVTNGKYIYDSTNMSNSHNSTIKNNITPGAKYATRNGDYMASTSAYSNFNEKTSSQEYLLTTGAWEDTKVNNIYDMSGNVEEYTMEGYTVHSHAVRGGNFVDYYTNNANARNWKGLGYYGCEVGSRIALYIK